MKRTALNCILSTALVGAIFSPFFAQAQYQNQEQGQQQGDPPARVARLTYEQGAVSLQTAGADQWTDPGKNYPLTSGDRVYADNGARAEIQTGQTVVRLSSATDLTITNLTEQLTQLGLAQGTVRLRTYGIDPQATVELDTPNGAITVVRPGDIRVDSYTGDGGTVVTVNTGAVQVSGPSLSQEISPGQSVRLTGDNPVQLTNVGMPRYDDFDRFSIDRDRRILNSQSARYVSRDVVGYDDLDESGSWNTTYETGPVWYPNDVPVGWAPYHDGHWAYVQPWGWTWVDNAPWGFAPFHYGRWSYYGNRWGWVPGPVAVVPVYSPALVVFVGGIGIGFGGGGVSAWFPLGVGEPYVPWYHCSPRYVRQVNVTNINITNIHNTTVVNNYNTFINNTRNVTNVNNINVANIHYAHQQTAVTAVPARDFAAGRPVAQSAVKVDPAQLRQATVVRQGPVAVKPMQAALVRPVSHAAPPVAVARPVVLTKAGPAVALPNARPMAKMPARLGDVRPGQQNQPVQQTQAVQPGNHSVRPVTAGARPGQPTATQPVNQQPHLGQVGQPGQPAVVGRAPAPVNNNAPQPLITRNPEQVTASPNVNRLPLPNHNGGNAPVNNVQNNGQNVQSNGQRPQYQPLSQPQNQHTVPLQQRQAPVTAPQNQTQVRPQYQPQQQQQHPAQEQTAVRPQYQPPQHPAPVQQYNPQNQRSVPTPEVRAVPVPQNQARPQYEPQHPAQAAPAEQYHPQQQHPAPEPRVTQERPVPPPQAYSRPAPQPQYHPAPQQQAQQYHAQPPQSRPEPHPAPQQQHDGKPSGR
jgi:hypothetical protein